METISKFRLLSQKEENELGIRSLNGDLEARDELVKSNLRLVVKIAHDYKHSGVPLEDLVQSGNIGLMKAASKFDPSKGGKFSTYSSWWIKCMMTRCVNYSRHIRIPCMAMGKTITVGRMVRDGMDRKSISRAMNMSERSVKFYSGAASTSVTSMNDKIDGEDGTEFVDAMSDDSKCSDVVGSIADDEIISMISSCIEDVLDERERTIIVGRYGLDGNGRRTLEEVSAEVGVTRERVRQIQEDALKKLRRAIDR